MQVSHSYIDGVEHSSGYSNLLSYYDLVNNNTLVKPSVERLAQFTLIYDTLCTCTLTNDSRAPIPVYNAIKQQEPPPIVYNGLEIKGFVPNNTNNTRGNLANTHIVNGKLADLLKSETFVSPYITSQAKLNNWKAGDVIGIGYEMGYRNHGKMFWTGKRIVHMDTSIDDYGSVPDVFPITGKSDGFDAHTWLDQVDHNALVPVDFGAKIGNEINAYLLKKELDYIVFTVHNVNWAVCGRGYRKPLVNGKGIMNAANASDLVNDVMTKYNIPLRQVLTF